MNRAVLDNYHFSYAITMADVKKVVEYCKVTGYCAHDYETSGHHSSNPNGFPTCISIAFQPGYAYVIPLAHKDSPNKKGNKWLKILKYIGRELIQNDRITKVAHNFKFEHGWWLKYGIKPRGVILDTMLLKYLLNEQRPHDLKSLAYSFFPEYANYSIKGEETERTPEDTVKFWTNVPLETLAPYNALDSDLCLRLAIYLESRVRELGFYQLYRNLLEMASYNLAEVESRGYWVDRPYLDGLVESYKIKIEEAEKKMYSVPSLVKYNKKRLKAAKKALLGNLLEQIEIKTNELDETEDKRKASSLQRSITNLQKKYDNYSAGVGITKSDQKTLEPLNLKSVKQLIDFLYYSKYGLKLPIIKYTEDKKTKKPTNNPATSEDVLLELREKDETGFIDTLLKYREMTKLYSTYIVGIRDVLNPDNTLHGSFLIHGCVTEDTVLVGKERDIVIGDIAPKEVGVKDVVKDNIYVLTHAGTWEQVTHTINKGVLDTYRVTTDRGDVLECTKYHKLLTPRGFKPLWKIAKYDLDVIMHDVSRLDIQPVEVGKKYGEVVFKEIPNWPGYLASSEGKIFSVKIPGAQGMLDYNNPHEMVPRVQKSGNRLHSRVGLRNGTGIKKMLPVSRLVWSAFNNASIPDGYVIDHIDCNPLNNIPENLQCITYSENTKRAYKNTRTAFTNGAINGKTVLDTQTVGQILLDHREGLTQGQIVEKYGISQAQVRRVINGESWKYIYLTKIRVEYIGKKTIMDLSVNDKHSYVTRSNYVSCNTVTGRLSSRNPNLQNMPRDTTASDIKQMFVCPPGKVMMQLDYSAAEFRVVAGWSQDKQMLEWFRVGHDIHLATACKKYGEDYDEINKIYSNEDDPNYKEWKVKRKQAKCYSGDTEILTPTGWQRLDSYDGKSLVAQYNFDTEEISWVKPSAYGKVLSKDNYTYKSRTVSLDVTSTHKTLFVTRYQKKVRTDFKNLVNKSGYMPVAGKVNFKFEDENLTRFLAMFTADGNTKNQWEKIRFGFSKEHKANRCRELLALCNIDYTEALRNGKHYFCIIKKTNQPLYQWLSKWVSRDKELSWECLSHISGKIYLEEAQYWDSNISDKTGYVSFSTVVKQTAQVMQALGHMNGIMVSFSETRVGDRIRYHLGYNLRRDTHLTRVDLNNSILTKTEGGRDMWGVTVDDHNLLVRKDNKIVLSGNTIGFGILYQQGPNHLKESLSTDKHKATKEEALEFLEEWFEIFPGVKRFVNKQMKFAEKHGYVLSPFGRKRRLPDAKNKRDRGKHAKALRDAINAPIQGTASDFALFSSILIREKIMRGELPSSIEQIGTIHDSLMFYLDPKDMNDKVVDQLFDICRDPDTQKYFGFKLKGITMAVDFELGLRWSKLRGYERGTDYSEVYKECYIPYWWENKETRELQGR